MHPVLIADSGSTKTQWCLLSGEKKRMIRTQGISPYFLNAAALDKILREELLPKMNSDEPGEIFYYGTGCGNPENISLIKKGLQKIFRGAKIKVDTDLAGAAKALCGDEKGMVSILGTGSNCGYYTGRRIVKSSPALGFILGDEGSGAYMGRRVLQHYLYNTFEAGLMEKFREKYPQDRAQILDNIYKQPLPNRFLAGFTYFLAENRGHYMIENIIEDCLNDFFFMHLYKFREAWTQPLSFTGSVAWTFKDSVIRLCLDYELQPGSIIDEPMPGLISYHKKH